MVCFFKSIETFATIGQAEVTDYNVPLGSSGGSTGKVNAVGELTQSYTRQWLILGGNLFFIEDVSPADGMTEITVGDPLAAFSRTLVYTEPSTYILGEWIRELVNTEFASLTDPAYDMPYLSCVNSDTTEFAHVYPKDGLFSLEGVMRDAQSRGIVLTFTFTQSELELTISPGDTTIYPIVAGDGHTQLVSETYSKTAIAKVTVISLLGYPHTYYLGIDGSISTEVPLNRAEGEWVTVKQGEENLLNTAAAAFAQNIESHKIQFYSDERLGLFNSVNVRLKDKVYTTKVTYIGRYSKDSRYIYRCGELPTTLTDKIESLSQRDVDATVTRLSELQNDVGYITASEAPVQSVNGKTGAITISDLMGLSASAATTYPTKAGMYAVTANIFSNLSPTQYYGLLTIENVGNYQRHIFQSAGNRDIYIGWREASTVAEPSTWTNLAPVEDTGWISLGLASNVTAGSDGSEKSGGLYYRVVNGNHVYVRGSVAFSYTGSGIVLGANPVPSAYRVGKPVYDWCICNGRYIARAYVATNGAVTLGYVQLLTATSNTTSATISNCVINIDYYLD